MFQETRNKLADLCSESKVFLHKPLQIEQIATQLCILNNCHHSNHHRNSRNTHY